MGIINQTKISEDQVKLLENVLRNIPSGNYTYNLIRNIANSPIKNNNVIITRGVHYNEFDSFGPYHFNIKLINRGIVQSFAYHVYVIPKQIIVNPGIFIAEDNSLIAGVIDGYWFYTFDKITQ